MGGLRDTVSPYNPHDGSGTGWTFGWADAGAFRDAMGNALYTYREFRDSFRCARAGGDMLRKDVAYSGALPLGGEECDSMPAEGGDLLHTSLTS